MVLLVRARGKYTGGEVTAAAMALCGRRPAARKARAHPWGAQPRWVPCRSLSQTGEASARALVSKG